MYNGILFSHEKEGNSAICNNMDGPEGTMLSEISQTKTTLYAIIYMQNLKKLNSQKQSTKMVTRGWGGGQEKWGDVGQRIQTSSYKTNKLWRPNVEHGDYS